MDKVSIIIAGRTEKYFQKTIDSALQSATGDIEIIAVSDGEPYDGKHPHSDDPRVRVIKLDKSIGQRAGYNLGVRESTGKYVMKIDAHCLLSKGFDVELKKSYSDKTVVLPEMKRLDAENWCPKRGGETCFMYFGLDLYCHYWPQYGKDLKTDEPYPQVLTGQGSCWFTSREWNDYIGLLDEKVGSWGNVGIEISLRTWLCGGQQVVNKNAWQAHYFRKDVYDPITKRKGFPYSLTGRDVGRAHRYTWDNYYFKDDAFEHQVRPFSWLIEKFQPPGWEAYLTDYYKAPRVIVFYTDSKLRELTQKVIKRLNKVRGLIDVVSVSQQRLNFGKNICIGEQPRKYRSVYEAVLKGVEATPEGSIIYLCEHDVFYHPSHFAFLPPEKGKLYFNSNRAYVCQNATEFLTAKGNRALSQCVARREDLIEHCKERLEFPGNAEEIKETWDELEARSSLKCDTFKSNRPNVDLLHGDNLTLKGKRKKSYVASGKGDIKNLPGWGGIGHFWKTNGGTAYIMPKIRNAVIKDPAEYLHNKLNNGQVSPVRVVRMKRNPDLSNLFAQLGYKEGAEVGVKYGKHSEVFKKLIPGLKLHCVDPWMEYQELNHDKMTTRFADQCYGSAKRRLEKYDNINFIRKTSVEGSKDFKDESLDFVYIDANHEFDFIMTDLILWAKKVRPGGIIAGHDYFRFRSAGVVPAVDTYTQQHQIYEWFITDEKAASFFWVKK